MTDKPGAVAGDSQREKGHGITLAEAFRTWLRIGLLSFGGPAGQIAVMHRILVDEKRWISESRFLHALNYCMLLPGPEAQQLTVYIGWLMHRTIGGLIAGVLFVLPGVVVIMALSILYAGFQDMTAVQAVFFGLKAAVLAIVVEAVFRIGRRALNNSAMYAIAVAAFAAIFLFDVPFPLIIAGAALAGFLGSRFIPRLFESAGHGDGDGGQGAAVDTALDRGDLSHTDVSPRHAMRISAIFLALWLGPVALLALVLGLGNVYVQEGIFFSKMAVVTFGGAYAVLAYVAQQAVSTYGWLQPGEMLDGLGMAETTPGPLIMVVQFVGFLAAFRNPGVLDPMVAGVLGGLLATWVTFVPCFLWIFLGAPFVEKLRGNRSLSAALTGITAAVVGVVMNLAVWFAMHVIFDDVSELRVAGLVVDVPRLSSVEPGALILTIAALLSMLVFRLGMVKTVLISTIAGSAYYVMVAAPGGVI